ncbi:hypothetical protein OG2516_15794 [Oceanicola granulosus HTCC2516]|uniref:DUF1178 family protein n=1 Tax=Oceanicola granulosus (strain ATCC BAA-861 / DSM 15982 / KCTC 12143 / HTCC2516) TaxID=314256 RepID=Q2CBV5_OCEGH|nr:DUF1178 family protein [Oceanicola granulosus]EAR50165.1 hypothetical protein OG2516_15794 [Oceanicola granulosus HTCC2516]
MIRYALKCTDDHRFDSWFSSAEAFDRLDKAGHVACAVCGSTEVTKVLMAPAVNTDRPLSRPASVAEQKLAEMRRKLEANSEDVGAGFVKEARAMHEGEAPHRQIHGTAKLDEARKLVEDGVPVLPLPFLPKRQSN